MQSGRFDAVADFGAKLPMDVISELMGVLARVRALGEKDLIWRSGAMTVDHLFAEVWTRPGLSLRDRRLLLLGMLVGQNALRRLAARGEAERSGERLIVAAAGDRDR